MAPTILHTSDFQVQYDPAEFTQPGELPQVQQRAQDLAAACESDYATLCEWFGIAVGAGLGPRNRVIVTLTKSVRGASNNGYSTHHPQMHVNPELGAPDGFVFGLFVAEMIEILMSYKGNWNPSNSGGEGLSRVAAELLHPEYAPHGQDNFVNAWLAADPTTDPTSAVADSEYRKDWVSANFTGGPLKSGGSVRGDDDSYSYGCAMLFIYYLKDQLNYSMSQIVQSGAASLDATYRLLTNGRTDGFSAFKALLDVHFPIGNAKSPTDDPFPLAPLRSKDTLTNIPDVVGLAGYYAKDDDTQHVIAGTSSGNLIELYWKPAQGVHQDVLTQFSSRIVGVGGYYAADDDTQHAIVATADGVVTEVYWKPAQGVHRDVLTKFGTGIVGLAGYYAKDDDTQHVIVGTKDGVLTELYWKPAQGVHQDVLTQFSSRIVGVGGYYAADDDTQHAIVATADGVVTEVYWKPAQGVHQDVVAQLGRGIVGLAGYYAADDHAQHVIVGTSSDTLMEVFWRPAQGVHQDIVAQLGASIVGVGGYYAQDDDAQHAIVATSDGALTEIYWQLS